MPGLYAPSEIIAKMNKAIRILFVTAEPWPTFRSDVATLFGKYLPNRGVHADLLAAKAVGVDDRPWGGGTARLCTAGRSQAARHWQFFCHVFRETACADLKGYDAIQVRDLPLLATVGLLLARMKGLRFYYWMSYPMPEGQIELAKARGLSQGFMKFAFPWVRGRVGRLLLYRLVLPMADHVFVQSHQMQEDLISRGISATKTTPVPMGVDFESIGRELVLSADPRLSGKRAIVYLGSLDQSRRIEVLFEMLGLVRQTEPSAVLVLVGGAHDADHIRWLRSEAHRVGVGDAVLWTGWLEMREGWRYVRAADVCVSPVPRSKILDASSPTKLPEYIALGVPVVCNDNPDQKQLIEASGGGLCVPYTAQSFADGVLEIFAWSKASRAQCIARGTRYVAQKRDYSSIATFVANQYRSMLHS